jgi:hypothetical protein
MVEALRRSGRIDAFPEWYVVKPEPPVPLDWPRSPGLGSAAGTAPGLCSAWSAGSTPTAARTCLPLDGERRQPLAGAGGIVPAELHEGKLLFVKVSFTLDAADPTRAHAVLSRGTQRARTALLR